MDKKVIIITHSGGFHTDDVFAVATLLLLLKDKPVVATIVRTRDESVFSSGDFVVDVGAVYDEEHNRFDHHQVGGAGQRENGVPYAAFGLVWKKYGAQVSGSTEVSDVIERSLVQYVDAMDNGIGELKPIVADVFPYSIHEIIGSFNPSWREKVPDYDSRFSEAVNFASQLLSREVRYAEDFLKSQEAVLRAYNESTDKRIIILDKNYVWEGIVHTLPEPLYVVEPATDGWKVSTVKDNPNSFVQRMELPAAWAGKRDAELVAVTGVSDAVFCHNRRFRAIARSKEGAIALAQKALES